MTRNTVDQIMRYEAGEMDDGEKLEFFQSLVDSGLAWQLQGHYGRTASDLIRAGLVNLPPIHSSTVKTDNRGQKRGE